MIFFMIFVASHWMGVGRMGQTSALHIPTNLVVHSVPFMLCSHFFRFRQHFVAFLAKQPLPSEWKEPMSEQNIYKISGWVASCLNILWEPFFFWMELELLTNLMIQCNSGIFNMDHDRHNNSTMLWTIDDGGMWENVKIIAKMSAEWIKR